MEVTINHNHGQIILRSGFFPASKATLTRIILPCVREDPRREDILLEMVTYCTGQANYYEAMAKAEAREGLEAIEHLPENKKPAFRKRLNNKVKKLAWLAKRYRTNAEVIADEIGK